MAISRPNTTAAVEGYLDQLTGVRGESVAEPVIRALLARSFQRLHHLCSTMLGRSCPRLMRPPLNLDAQEMLSAIVERLLKAVREARPQSVRQFYALAGQYMRWELNDLARRLERQTPPFALRESVVPDCMQSEASQLSPNARRMLGAIDALPDDEREIFSLVRIQRNVTQRND